MGWLGLCSVLDGEGVDSPINQCGDYDSNLTEAGKKSLHQACA